MLLLVIIMFRVVREGPRRTWRKNNKHRWFPGVTLSYSFRQIETNLKEKAPFWSLYQFVWRPTYVADDFVRERVCVFLKPIYSLKLVFSRLGKCRDLPLYTSWRNNCFHGLYYKKRSHIDVNFNVHSPQGSPASPPRNLTHSQENWPVSRSIWSL